jgi:uncharacterized membrane protein YeiB
MAPINSIALDIVTMDARMEQERQDFNKSFRRHLWLVLLGGVSGLATLVGTILIVLHFMIKLAG